MIYCNIGAIRRFRVLIRSQYQGQIGVLEGPVDYLGCRNGWHTLRFPDGNEGLFAGEEVREVTNKEAG